MKRLIILCLLLFLPSVVQAVTVTWDHDGENTEGYYIYFWETSKPGPDNEYHIRVKDATVRQLTIENERFIPNVEYTFVGTAYNQWEESPRSDQVTFIRQVPLLPILEDKLPTAINIIGPATINITIAP